MDMGKCTSCILYIKQNPTTYKETTISQRNSTLIAAFLLESSTTNQHILFRAISLLGKIFGAFLACSSLGTANPFRIERPIKRGARVGESWMCRRE
jgi:hypothetical protein